MTRPATQGERLTILETEAKMRAEAGEKAAVAVVNELKRMNDRLGKIEADIRATNERLSGHENRGKGLLIGVGIFGTGIGASFLAALAQIWGWFK